MAEGSVIGQGTVVRGNVRGDGSIEIYGRVDGDVVVTGDVTLGEQASVRGDVSGARVTVGGNVTGELRGSEALVIERTAQVTGDMTAPRIAIEEGARANGALRTAEPPSGRAEPRRAAAPRPAEVRRQEPERAEPVRTAPAARPVARQAPPPPAPKREPPAPVVPAFRGIQGRKKKARSR